MIVLHSCNYLPAPDFIFKYFFLLLVIILVSDGEGWNATSQPCCWWFEPHQRIEWINWIWTRRTESRRSVIFSSHSEIIENIIFAALAALAGGSGRGQSTHQTHEMTVPNEIIGCVIGKGGSKIAEIR